MFIGEVTQKSIVKEQSKPKSPGVNEKNKEVKKTLIEEISSVENQNEIKQENDNTKTENQTIDNDTTIDNIPKDTASTVQPPTNNEAPAENLAAPMYTSIYPSLDISPSVPIIIKPEEHVNAANEINNLMNVYNAQYPTAPAASTLNFPAEYLDNDQDFVFVPSAPSESILFYMNEEAEDQKQGKHKKKKEIIYNKEEINKLYTFPLTEPQLSTMLNNQEMMNHEQEVKEFRKQLEKLNSNFYNHIKNYEDLIYEFQTVKSLVNRKILEINRNISDSWKFEQILKNISRTCGDGVRFSYQYVTEITSIDEEVMSRLSDTFKEFVDQLNQLADLQFRVEEEKNWIDNYLYELVYYSFVNEKNSNKSEDTSSNKNVKKEDAKKSGSSTNTNTNTKTNNNNNTTNTGKESAPAAPTNTSAGKTSAPTAPTNTNSSKTSASATPTNTNASKASTPVAPANASASKTSAPSNNSNSKQETNKSTSTKEEKKEGDEEKGKDEKNNKEEDEPITKTLTIEKMKKYLNILFYFIRKYKDSEFTQQLYEAMNDDAEEDDVEEEEIQIDVKDKKESHDIEVSDLECGDINNIYITKDFKVKGKTSKCTIFTFVNNLKKWVSQLVACLLTLDDFNLHQFILLQCLRTKGISSWGANFIQVSYNKKTWNDQCINEFTARLNTLFLPVEEIKEIHDQKLERERLLEESFKQLELQGNWEVIREVNFEGPVNLSFITEEDYLSLLSQFNILDHYYSFVNRMVANYKDNYSNGQLIHANQYILKVISVSNSLLDIFKNAFHTFNLQLYPLLVKKLGYILSRMTVFYGETFESILQFNKEVKERQRSGSDQGKTNKKSPDLSLDEDEISNGFIKTKIQNEIDGFILKSFQILVDCPNADIWQFMIDMPFHAMSTMACWNILCCIFHFKLTTNDFVKLLNEKLEHSIFTVLSNSKFINNFSRPFDESPDEAISIVRCLVSLSLSRHKKFGQYNEELAQMKYTAEELLMVKLMYVVIFVVFDISYINNGYREDMHKFTLDYFVCLCNEHPPLIAFLLRLVNQNYKSIGSMGIYLFKALPLYKYQIHLEELAILESFLTQSIDSDRFKFSQFVIQNLNLGCPVIEIEEDKKEEDFDVDAILNGEDLTDSQLDELLNDTGSAVVNNNQTLAISPTVAKTSGQNLDVTNKSDSLKGDYIKYKKEPIISLSSSMYIPKEKNVSSTNLFLPVTVHRKLAYILINTALKVEKEYREKGGLLNTISIINESFESVVNTTINSINTSSKFLFPNKAKTEKESEVASEKASVSSDEQEDHEGEEDIDFVDEKDLQGMDKLSDKVKEFKYWCWEILIQLHLFQYPISQNSNYTYREISNQYLSYQSQTLMHYRNEMNHNAMVAYLMLANTDLGHKFNLFQEQGWPLLDVIMKKGPEKALVTICSNIFSEYIYTDGIEKVCHQDQFIQFFGNFFKSSTLFNLRNKNSKRNNKLIQYINRIMYESYIMEEYNHDYFKCYLLFWMEAIFSNYNGWINNTESIELMDQIAKISFTFHRNQDIINLLYSDFYEKYYYNENNNINNKKMNGEGGGVQTFESVNFNDNEYISINPDHGGQPIENLGSIQQEVKDLSVINNKNSGFTSQSDRLKYIIISITDSFFNLKIPKHETKYWYTFHSLMAESLCEQPIFMHLGHLLTEYPDITVNDKVITEAITKPLNQFTIYKWAKAILALPVEHELMPLYFQLFFYLYFAKVEKQGPLGYNPYYGYRFFSTGRKNENLIKDIKNKLVECRKYHATCSGPTKLNENLAHLYNAMHLWLNEPKIHTGEFYIGNLKEEYLTSVLSSILSNQYPFNSVDNLWWDYVDGIKLKDELMENYYTKIIKGLRINSHAIQLRRSSINDLDDSFIEPGKPKQFKPKKPATIEECPEQPPEVDIKPPIFSNKYEDTIHLDIIYKLFMEKIKVLADDANHYHGRLEKLDQFHRQYMINLRQLYYTETLRNQIERRCNPQSNALNLYNNAIITNIMNLNAKIKSEGREEIKNDTDESTKEKTAKEDDTKKEGEVKEKTSADEDTDMDNISVSTVEEVKKIRECSQPAILVYNYQKSYLMKDSQKDLYLNVRSSKVEMDGLFKLSSDIYEATICLIDIMDYLVFIKKNYFKEKSLESDIISSDQELFSHFLKDKSFEKKKKELEKMTDQMFYNSVDALLKASKYYPPATFIINKLINDFGEQFILPSKDQVDKIYERMKKDNSNIQLFISLFQPSLCDKRFIELYHEISLSKDLFNLDNILLLLNTFNIKEWLDHAQPPPTNELKLQFLNVLFKLITHCSKQELIEIHYLSLKILLTNNGQHLDIMKAAFKYLMDCSVEGTIEPSLYLIYIESIGGDIELIDTYLNSSDATKLRINNETAIELLYFISNTYYTLRNKRERLYYIFSKYLNEMFDLIAIIYCSLGFQDDQNGLPSTINPPTSPPTSLPGSHIPLSRDVMKILEDIVNYDDTKKQTSSEDISNIPNPENEIQQKNKESKPVVHAADLLDNGIVSPKTELYWKLVEYLFQPWIVLANLGSENLAPTAWDIEHKSKIQKLLRTFSLLTSRYLSTVIDKTNAIQNVWNFYKKCVESRQPDYILYSINERFLSFSWEHFNLNYENISTLFKWKCSKWLTSEVQRFLNRLLEMVDWGIPMNNGNEAIDYRIEMLLSIVFYLIRGTDDIMASSKQQESYFAILNNKCFQKINWSNLNSTFYQKIIEECPKKYPSGSPALMFTVSSLKAMTGAYNITNDLRKTEQSFKKMDTFFEFICQLIKEQLQIFGTPINFNISKIGMLIKSILEFIDLAVLHTNEMQNDEGMKQFTFEILCSSYQKIIQLMNICQAGDCFFIELWIGISYYVTSSTHYPISVLSTTHFFNNIEYMAVLNELCIQKHLAVTSKDTTSNLNPWTFVIKGLSVPELELNEYINICKSHGLFLTLYTYGLQKLETINDDFISNMNIVQAQPNNDNGYGSNPYRTVYDFLKEIYTWILAFKSESKEFSENNIILVISLFADIMTIYPEISQYTYFGRFLTKMVETLMNWVEPKNKILVNLGLVKKTRFSKNFQFYLRSFLIYLANTIQFFPNFKQMDGLKKSNADVTINLAPIADLEGTSVEGDEEPSENVASLSANSTPKGSPKPDDIFYWDCEKYLNSLKMFPVDNSTSSTSETNDKNYIGWLDDTIDSILALQPDNPLLILFRKTSSFADQLRIKLFPTVKKYYHI